MSGRGRHHRHYLIDGHNVLYRHPTLRRLMPEDCEEARRRFERQLAGLARCHLFYDGGPGGAASRTQRHGCAVHYSGAGGCADDAIIAALRAREGIRCDVVTDDRELAGRARAHGARVVSVAAFLERCAAATSPAQASAVADRGPPPAGEVAVWLRAFGVTEDGD